MHIRLTIAVAIRLTRGTVPIEVEKKAVGICYAGRLISPVKKLADLAAYY